MHLTSSEKCQTWHKSEVISANIRIERNIINSRSGKIQNIVSVSEGYRSQDWSNARVIQGITYREVPIVSNLLDNKFVYALISKEKEFYIMTLSNTHDKGKPDIVLNGLSLELKFEEV